MNSIAALFQWLASSRRRAFLILFLLGFSLRIGILSLIPRSLIPPNPKWETGAVALSLLQKGEFADPYLIPTGPTAHTPPLQVGLFTGLYKIFGYTHLGGLIRWTLVMAAHASIFALLPWFSGRLGMAPEAGAVGGLAGALNLHWPYELESLSALALAFLLLAFLGRWQGLSDAEALKPVRPPGAWRSLLLGIVVGISFHLQPALLPVVLGLLVFELWWRKDRRKWVSVLLVVLGMLLACIPWGWRNYQRLGGVYFIRSNLGLELHVGNHDRAHADIDVSVARDSFHHPRTDLAEAEKVRDLGEAAYMRRKGQQAVRWIRSNPGEFLRLTATRIAFFWGGALHRFPTSLGYLLLTILAAAGAWQVAPSLRAFQRAALLIPLLTYPLIYYVVAYMPRYGHPVQWILFLLAGSLVWRWLGGNGREDEGTSEVEPRRPPLSSSHQ